MEDVARKMNWESCHLEWLQRGWVEIQILWKLFELMTTRWLFYLLHFLLKNFSNNFKMIFSSWILIVELNIIFIVAGFEWVGWSNDSVSVSGKPVELTFQFDTVRNFSAMVLHTNNMFSKGVQVSRDFNLIKQSTEPRARCGNVKRLQKGTKCAILIM